MESAQAPLLPQLMIAAVALAAVVGISIAIIKLLNSGGGGGGPNADKSNPCYPGQFQSIPGAIGEAGVEKHLKTWTREMLLNTRNAFLVDQYTTGPKAGGAVYHNKTKEWGVCDCVNWNTQRIIGAGATCESQLSLNDCKTVMPEGKEHVTLTAATDAVSFNPDKPLGTVAVESVCGCEEGYGWISRSSTKDMFKCEKLRGKKCSSKSDPSLQVCKNDSQRNDSGEYDQCCCSNCETQHTCWHQNTGCAKVLDCSADHRCVADTISGGHPPHKLQVVPAKKLPSSTCGCDSGFILEATDDTSRYADDIIVTNGTVECKANGDTQCLDGLIENKSPAPEQYSCNCACGPRKGYWSNCCTQCDDGPSPTPA
jgi:hypothetical protein